MAWGSRRQQLSAVSAAESETVATYSAIKHTFPIWVSVREIFAVQDASLLVFLDNRQVISLAKNGASDKLWLHSKSINARLSLLQDLILAGWLRVEWVSTLDQLADIFTKPLQRFDIEAARRSLGIL